MTKDELAKACVQATRVDRRRLNDGYEALRLFTVSDLRKLNTRELRAAERSLVSAIAAMQSLDPLGSPEAEQIAWEALSELQRRRTFAQNRIEHPSDC